jgi:hypothetical protein
MWRRNLGGAIGLMLGALIGIWFHGPQPDLVLNAMAMVCAALGMITGIAVSGAGSRGKAVVALGGGLIACLLVGLVMLLYRWLNH